MQVSLESQLVGCLVRVAGEIDMSTSPPLREHLVDLVGRKVSPIRIDMGKVTYIDSSGIATLVECLQGVQTYQGELVLLNVTGDVKDVFELVRLDSIFKMG